MTAARRNPEEVQRVSPPSSPFASRFPAAPISAPSKFPAAPARSGFPALPRHAVRPEPAPGVWTPVRESPFAVGRHQALVSPVSTESVLVRPVMIAAMPILSVSGADVSYATCLCGGDQGHDPNLYFPGALIDFDEVARRLGEDDHRDHGWETEFDDEYGEEGWCPYEPPSHMVRPEVWAKYGRRPGRACGCPHRVSFNQVPLNQAWRGAPNVHQRGDLEDGVEELVRAAWLRVRPMLRARRDQVRRTPRPFMGGIRAGYAAERVHRLLGLDLDENDGCSNGHGVGRAIEEYSDHLLRMIDRGERALEILDALAEEVVNNDLRAAFEYVCSQHERDYQSWMTPQPGSTDYERGLRDALSDKDLVQVTDGELPILTGRQLQTFSCGPLGLYGQGDGAEPRGVWVVTQVAHHHMLDSDAKDDLPFMTSWRRAHLRPHEYPNRLQSWRRLTKWETLTPRARRRHRLTGWYESVNGKHHTGPYATEVGVKHFDRKEARLEQMRTLWAKPEEILVYTDQDSAFFHFWRECGADPWNLFDRTGDDRVELTMADVFQLVDEEPAAILLPCSACPPPPPDGEVAPVGPPQRWFTRVLHELLDRLGGETLVTHVDGSDLWHVDPECWVLAHAADGDEGLHCVHSARGMKERTGWTTLRAGGAWYPCLSCLPPDERRWVLSANADAEHEYRLEQARQRAMRQPEGAKPKGKKKRKKAKAKATA